MKFKRNDGFTLVEFVITIAIASMITLAATTMLLLGLRIHHKSTTIAAQQNTISMLYSVMDTIAAESGVKVDKVENEASWLITAGSTKIAYDADNETILLNDAAFAKGITAATADKPSNLLTINLETEHNNYSFSVYCRKGDG